MDRHDFTKQQRDLLNHAVAIDLVDGVELGCVMATAKGDFVAILETLQSYAWACRNSDQETRSAWNKAREEYDSWVYAERGEFDRALAVYAREGEL